MVYFLSVYKNTQGMKGDWSREKKRGGSVEGKGWERGLGDCGGDGEGWRNKGGEGLLV